MVMVEMRSQGCVKNGGVVPVRFRIPIAFSNFLVFFILSMCFHHTLSLSFLLVRVVFVCFF
jgi:hypothetical protein